MQRDQAATRLAVRLDDGEDRHLGETLNIVHCDRIGVRAQPFLDGGVRFLRGGAALDAAYWQRPRYMQRDGGRGMCDIADVAEGTRQHGIAHLCLLEVGVDVGAVSAAAARSRHSEAETLQYGNRASVVDVRVVGEKPAPVRCLVLQQARRRKDIADAVLQVLHLKLLVRAHAQQLPQLWTQQRLHRASEKAACRVCIVLAKCVKDVGLNVDLKARRRVVVSAAHALTEAVHEAHRQ